MSAGPDQLTPHGDQLAQTSDHSGTATVASSLPAPTYVAPLPLSKITLATCGAATILISLFIITAVCSRLLQDINHPIIEALILAVIVVWASIPRANSDTDLFFKAAHHAVMLFSILYFIAYQTTTAFWLTFIVLVSVVLDEHRRRLDNEPLYTKIAQTVTIIFVIAHLLLKFTAFFLSSLQATLTAQFDYLYQFLKLREILAVIVGSIILYATTLRTVHRFRSFEWREYAIPPNVPEAIAAAVHDLIYYIGNFFRIIGIAFVTVLREAIVYTWKTFFSTHLWRTILYIAATAAVSALLVADVLYVQPYLVQVLRNPEPFFAPSAYLILSYVVIATAFAVAAGGVAALIRIRLSRTTLHPPRHPAYQTFTLASSGIFICIWVAAFTAWVVNSILHLDDEQFVTAGYFTCVAIIFAIRAAISAIRAGELRSPPAPDAT